jgi:ATP phosphoribosyltransferase
MKKRSESMKLRIGLPKGSLQQATIEIFRKAGYQVIVSERSYVPQIDDDELEGRLLRAQEIPRYVGDGVIDCGLSGHDWIKESGAKVHEVTDLVYAKQGMRPVRWVLAVWDEAPIRKVADLEGKRVATELVQVTKRFLRAHGVRRRSSTPGAPPRRRSRSSSTPSSNSRRRELPSPRTTCASSRPCLNRRRG